MRLYPWFRRWTLAEGHLLGQLPFIADDIDRHRFVWLGFSDEISREFFVQADLLVVHADDNVPADGHLAVTNPSGAAASLECCTRWTETDIHYEDPTRFLKTVSLCDGGRDINRLTSRYE